MVILVVKLILEWFAITWIVKRFIAAKPTEKPIRSVVDFTTQLNQLQAKINVSIENSSLREQVTLDAITRENRAKSALVAVLTKQGVSKDQIDRVLATIDGEE